MAASVKILKMMMKNEEEDGDMDHHDHQQNGVHRPIHRRRCCCCRHYFERQPQDESTRPQWRMSRPVVWRSSTVAVVAVVGAAVAGVVRSAKADDTRPWLTPLLFGATTNLGFGQTESDRRRLRTPYLLYEGT